MIDQFAIAFEVARHWLPEDEQGSDNRANVLRALSRPQVTDPEKAARRLTVGWFIATPDGGYHNLGAEPLRSLSNRVVRGTSIEETIGDQPIERPTVVVRLAKAGLSIRNFQPSYGDTLRINEAGKPTSNIDLANVRDLTRLTWRVKPGAKWVYQTRRALVEAKFGNPAGLQTLPSHPSTMTLLICSRPSTG
ncbi:hypothetical protein G5V57_23205 [Nordella sp. HKS 07]|uniref:hypothetical protein n=1 Tax=Nordella sp. HKS 07 TaxID=2712222 RepID=UPI0013E1F746|nr:hypothetical protein [Nordella sp. HKS 07]QIG50380.1 hypothetical protein G5V57_23205 [Nordella sp. HKS 07]